MRIILFVLSLFLFLAFGMCKKVTKKVNSEKSFLLFALDSVGQPTNVCFDRVWGDGKSDLVKCTNEKEGIGLPLNIDKDSTTFYFQKGLKLDTLTIVYQKSIEPASIEFEVKFTVKKLKCSLKKFTNDCINDLTPNCNGDKASFSATFYQ